MNTFLRTCLTASTLGLATFLAAQQPATAADPRVGGRASLRDAVGLAATADGLQAIAMDYHADFAAGGVAYTPHLGSAAPRDLPLHWSMREVRRGAELLHRAKPVAPQQHEQSVHYPRGPVLETYDVTARGLKQSFVFAQPIGGDGDLVVRCDWRSELLPQADADGSIDFQWPEVGGVHLGQVVGIDAAGQRAMGSLRLDGSVLELVLPDAFVDVAKYPLVLDPLIGTGFPISTSSDSFESDVAVDPVSGTYLVAFQVRASAPSTYVYAQRTSANGSLLAALVSVDSGGTSRHPRVAMLAASQRFLVTWQFSTSPFGPFDIRCAALDLLTGGRSGIVDVAATVANEFDPAVGGDVTTSDDDAVVVWCTDAEMSAAQVTVQATGDPIVNPPLLLGASSTFRRPALNKACGASARFLVVWEEGSPGEVWARYISRNLTQLGTPLLLSSSPLDDTNPSVDGDNGTFLVTWERVESAVPTFRDIVAVVVVGNTSGIAINQPETVVSGVVGEDEMAPDVAYLGSRYALVYVQKISPMYDDVRAVLVNPDCSTCGQNFQLAGIGVNVREGAPRITGRWVGPNVSDVAMVSYSEADRLPPFRSDIVGQLIEAQSNGLPITNVGGACALGGTNGSSGGPFVLGNSSFAFRVTGADPNALLFLSLGFPSGGISCGLCALTNPLAFQFKVNTNGASTSPFPIPCDPAFAGTNFEWQWVSFLTAFNPCPNAPGLSASNRLQATIGL